MSKAAELAALIGGQKALGDKNFIINGDMQCWQRATAATTVTNAYATVDRYKFTEATSGAFSSERATDYPTGTGYSLKLQVTTADTSMASGDYAYVMQPIEAQNLQSLGYGTSSAKTLTLSFWVKSSKTGTYTITLAKPDNTGYNFLHEYAISSANTWEKKSITISPTAGSTSFITSAAGAINNDNGHGLYVFWMLCSGTDLNGGTNNSWSTNTLHYTTTNQVNWMDSTSNNFYLSQAQLEIGEVATPFQHESFGTTLAKCQRYYDQSSVSTGSGPWYLKVSQLGDTYGRANIDFQVRMRTSPTVTVVNNNTSYTSSGVQLLSPHMASPYINSMSSGAYNHLDSWTADAEL
jgi:hypothetical protein